MGDPRRLTKKYSTPNKPWDKGRIVLENDLIETYGLRNKKEVWIAKTMLGRKRNSARKLLAGRIDQIEKDKKILIDSLKRLGILSSEANLDDVLTLNVEVFLERRLQTLVFRRGLANTVKQARQFITHGLISINGRKISAPGYLVPKVEEEFISYYNGKPKILDVKEEAPELQKAQLQKESATENTAENTAAEVNSEVAKESVEKTEKVVQ